MDYCELTHTGTEHDISIGVYILDSLVFGCRQGHKADQDQSLHVGSFGVVRGPKPKDVGPIMPLLNCSCCCCV